MHHLESTVPRFQPHHPAGRPILIAALLAAISLLLLSPLLPAIPARPETPSPDSAFNPGHDPISSSVPVGETASTTAAPSDTSSDSHSTPDPSHLSASDSSPSSGATSAGDSPQSAPAPQTETKRRIRTLPTLHGLFSTWGSLSRTSTNLGQFGARFLPEFSLELGLRSGQISKISPPSETAYPITGANQFPPTKVLSERLPFTASNGIYSSTATAPAISNSPSPSPHFSTLTLEFSLNIWGTLTVQQGSENQFRGQLKPYRLSLKYVTSRFEARLGLQKISFGSAALLRPLMWFDRIDPRDPIQLTDGVYGLLLRTYIATRTNLWAWALYGNDEPKGLEILPTKKRTPELGGRLQFPAGPGELALTAHHRQVDFNLAMAGNNPALNLIPLKPASPLAFNFPETRLAADGKWDIGPGFWFEATLTNQHSSFLAFPWRRALAIGLDYTLAAGNGLHLLTEYFQSDMATAALSGTTSAPFRARFLAASASYPFTLLDQLSAIVFYDTLNRNFYSFVRWQRTYDRWSFHLMVFWNPAEFRIFASPSADQPNLFAGKGLQLLLLYNF